MNHLHAPTPYLPSNAVNQLSDCFSSDEGCRILTSAIGDECKVLQDIKKILEKRASIDEQYAKNLQDLTANANKISWPISTHLIAPVSREIFSQWSQLAITMSSNAEVFRKTVLDNLIKELLEQKTDSKKFFEEERRRYDGEHRKAQRDVADADKRYLEEAKSYVVKNNELTKLQNSARRNDDSRVKSLKDAVMEKRANVYRAHNDYIFKIREYNLIDKEHAQKVRSLINYHEESQFFINKSWQTLLEAMTNHLSYKHDESTAAMGTLRRMITSVDPRHFYDEICKNHSNIAPLTTNSLVFNELLLQTSGLTKLKLNQFICNSSIKQELKQKIHSLTLSINEPIPKIVDFTRDKQNSYEGRKDLFEQRQSIDYTRVRKRFEEQLRDELKSTLRNVGYGSDDESNGDSDEDLTDRIEDQLYFHGVMPRSQTISKLIEKGDYLVRINEQAKFVLSIVWRDQGNRQALKDGHFLIHERNHMFLFQSQAHAKPSIPELISFYKRQKLELREDGTRLIRPIARPDYIVNNDDVRTLDTLGKGHFGNVVRGEYRGQFVAVKILHASSTGQSPQSRNNFINEALLLQQYKHKNIVKFLGIAAIRDPLMIIMELIEQGSLNNYLKDNDLRVSQLILMCYDIAKGMAYLEKRNVIHRDLAARNCLVDKKNRVKVADFGLSRCLQSDEEYFCQIKEIPIRWWAVEVFLNAPYTSKSDVWSYGVTIWEVFSKAGTPYENIILNHLVIDAVKRGERLKQPDKCPPKIFSIMASCWTDDPKDRPSFEKLLELLKKEKPLF
ncbi:unnamed protein product [Rotaria magnacalcarata]|uniref:Tyrosine-protein kinase n=4 Tax=Rotaria magnacalcarata TaxID=392030 RepID=A0A819LKS9_9BILA|nr:unnamed protein product [Rotaria magnacalcarata]CAF3967579.1 unnamed protein product [Rotaria magnacalcarata]